MRQSYNHLQHHYLQNLWQSQANMQAPQQLQQPYMMPLCNPQTQQMYQQYQQMGQGEVFGNGQGQILNNGPFSSLMMMKSGRSMHQPIADNSNRLNQYGKLISGQIDHQKQGVQAQSNISNLPQQSNSKGQTKLPAGSANKRGRKQKLKQDPV